eukprot:10717993-Alexandrium_andersonii.AAC.1
MWGTALRTNGLWKRVQQLHSSSTAFRVGPPERNKFASGRKALHFEPLVGHPLMEPMGTWMGRQHKLLSADPVGKGNMRLSHDVAVWMGDGK